MAHVIGSLYRSADAALATGVRLRYVEHGSPDGTPVVALHGITDSSFSYSPMLSHLPPSVRVIAPDQRGHGESERPREGYTMRDLARDALALMDALGIARATFVGHSMGTFVAREAALLAPDRVAALLLLAPGATGQGPGARELWSVVETMVDPIDPAFVYEFQTSTIHRPVPPEFLARVIEESLKVPARVWRAALASIVEIESAQESSGIRCETRIVWGERDTTFLLQEQEELARVIPGASLEILPDVGHAVPWEVPRLVAERVLRLALEGRRH